MTWFKVSDEFAFHPKVVSAGTAIATWIRAASWSAQQLTDGFIPNQMLPALGPKKDATRLVNAGLWHPVEGGYQFHDWDDYQPSRAQVQDKRAKRQDAGRKGGVRSGQSRREAQAEANASPDAVPLLRPGANPRPDPTRPVVVQSPRSLEESSVTRGQPTPAEQVVVAWSEAMRETGAAPIGDQTTTVGRQARELLQQGNDMELVLAAARLAGAKARPFIADFVGPAVAERRKKNTWHDDKSAPAHVPPPARDPFAEALAAKGVS